MQQMYKFFKFDLRVFQDYKYYKMILRSGKMIGSDSFTIDFDNASYEWRKNKISVGQGCFQYSKKKNNQ